jgi:carboxymethylenebutenolidase
MNGRSGWCESLWAAALLSLSLAVSAQPPAEPRLWPLAALHTERVQYALVDRKAVYGYLSRPADLKGPQPGVILIPMWWGLNQHMRDVADQLARQGYTVLVVDLFNGQVTRKRSVAARLADIAIARSAAVISNLEQAVTYMSTHQQVNQLGVVGWSIGGQWALKIASDLPQAFNALVIFYAAPYTEPSQLVPLRMPILAFFGGRDPFVPLPLVEKFQWAAGLASAQLDIHLYPGAQPGFDDPDSTAYNAAEARDAWQQMTAFLARNLKDQTQPGSGG